MVYRSVLLLSTDVYRSIYRSDLQWSTDLFYCCLQRSTDLQWLVYRSVLLLSTDVYRSTMVYRSGDLQIWSTRIYRSTVVYRSTLLDGTTVIYRSGPLLSTDLRLYHCCLHIYGGLQIYRSTELQTYHTTLDTTVHWVVLWPQEVVDPKSDFNKYYKILLDDISHTGQERSTMLGVR